jgi:N-acetylglutamate synthase-like GNAT family acetyltransferase
MEKAEEYAASLKIKTLYLLTVTAESFFLKRFQISTSLSATSRTPSALA